jgi:hypothetical protein
MIGSFTPRSSCSSSAGSRVLELAADGRPGSNAREGRSLLVDNHVAIEAAQGQGTARYMQERSSPEKRLGMAAHVSAGRWGRGKTG